jgi:hypothetical protein
MNKQAVGTTSIQSPVKNSDRNVGNLSATERQMQCVQAETVGDVGKHREPNGNNTSQPSTLVVRTT